MFKRLFITAALLTGLVAPVEASPLPYSEAAREKAIDLCASIDEGYAASSWYMWEMKEVIESRQPSIVLAEAIAAAQVYECPQYATHIDNSIEEVSNASYSLK